MEKVVICIGILVIEKHVWQVMIVSIERKELIGIFLGLNLWNWLIMLQAIQAIFYAKLVGF